MSGLEFGDPSQPLGLIFQHANGFNAQTYTTLLEPLATRARILAIDLEGHGGSPQRHPAEGRADWLNFRDDLVGLLDLLNAPPLVLAGHSMGATVALLAAAERPDRVRALVLIDPVLLPREAARQMVLSLAPVPDMPLITNARKRRRTFASRAAALDSYRGRGAFKTWPEAALADYVEGGFRDRPDGEVELICAPEWEAGNYAAQAHDPWAALARITAPVRILRAGVGSTCDLDATMEAADTQPNVRVETIDGATHFLPLERPDIVRRALEEAL